MQPGRLQAYPNSMKNTSVLLGALFAWLTVAQHQLKLHLVRLYAGAASALKTFDTAVSAVLSSKGCSGATSVGASSATPARPPSGRVRAYGCTSGNGNSKATKGHRSRLPGNSFGALCKLGRLWSCCVTTGCRAKGLPFQRVSKSPDVCKDVDRACGVGREGCGPAGDTVVCVKVPFGCKRRATQALLSTPVWEGAQIACRPSEGPAVVWLCVRPRGGA